MSRNHKRGRPSKMTDDCIKKLEEAFAIGCTDKEACLYAGISMQCLYDFQKRRPEFAERKALLKSKPVLKARKASDDLLTEGDPVHVRWFLEHKKADEFNTRAEVNIAVDSVPSIEERGEALDGLLKAFLDD